MIAIIDYDMGNLRSVQKAFEAVGHRAQVTRSRQVIADASHMVLPGVGAFGDCMRNLDAYQLIEPIKQSISSGKPFLGICLGMQLLFTEGHEFGVHRGLDIIPGKVLRFPSLIDNDHHVSMKIPHMGWNTLTIKKPTPMLGGILDGTFMYFVHSYYVQPDNPDVVCTATEYGRPFVSSILDNNIFACQFHPEKSQDMGLRLLRNFGSLV